MDLMIDSLGATFAEQGAFIGVCVLAIFLAFLVLRDGLASKWINVIFVACALWSTLTVLMHRPSGTDYHIYRHNASLTLSGQPAFGREATPEDGQYGGSSRHPRYLDYTGMQHLVYVGLTSLDLSGVHPSLAGFGFQVWAVVGLVAALLLIRYGKGSRVGDPLIQKAFAATMLSFHPVFALYWVVFGWEDKVIFLVLPLLLACLLDAQALVLAALLIGGAIGLNGLFVFFVPAFALYLFRARGKRAWLYLGLLCLGLVVTMLPFFPESLSGWSNRMGRLNAPTPFWFSIYLLLPSGIYTPTLDKAIVAVVVIASTLAYWGKRLDIRDMIVVSTCLALILGPFNSIQRVTPVIMLIAVLTPGKSQSYWALFATVLSMLLLVGRGLDPGNITPLHVVVFHIPFLWVLGWYICQRVRQSRPSGAAEAQSAI